MAGPNLRHQSDVRQLAGILFVLGACVLVFPIVITVQFLFPYLPDSGVPAVPIEDSLWQFFQLVGKLLAMSLGLLTMFMGYSLLVRLPAGERGSQLMTLIAIGWTLLALIEPVTTAYYIAENEWVKNDPETNYYVFVNIGSVFFLCSMTYGPVALILGALRDYQRNDVPSRDSTFYGKRLGLYSFLMFGLGISRFLLPGVKIYMDEGAGPYDDPLYAGYGFIVYPEFDIALGCSTTFLGLWGLLRGCGCLARGRIFGNLVAFNYLAYVGMKILVDVGWDASGPSNIEVAYATSMAIVFLPATIILSFLDDKRLTTPVKYGTDYYVDDSLDDEGVEFVDEEEITEGGETPVSKY